MHIPTTLCVWRSADVSAVTTRCTFTWLVGRGSAPQAYVTRPLPLSHPAGSIFLLPGIGLHVAQDVQEWAMWLRTIERLSLLLLAQHFLSYFLEHGHWGAINEVARCCQEPSRDTCEGEGKSHHDLC